jgi:hypothetical protein
MEIQAAMIIASSVSLEASFQSKFKLCYEKLG